MRPTEGAMGSLENHTRTRPLCIAGMHRSGTSTLAQILYRLGLDLGEESDLFAANRYNVDGYFEHKDFVAVSEKLLQTLGAGWDYPFGLDPGWHERPEIREVSEEARSLMGGFGHPGVWGWKDPRACLTVPFWLDLAPDLRVVASVRNPLEVAASIQSRGASSVRMGLNLWKVYNRSLLDNVPEGQLLITHYESFFRRPQPEFRRLVDFAGIHTSEQMISLVRSRVIRGVRHHVYTAGDLLDADPSGEVRDLYAELCERAEWTLDS